MFSQDTICCSLFNIIIKDFLKVSRIGSLRSKSFEWFRYLQVDYLWLILLYICIHACKVNNESSQH